MGRSGVGKRKSDSGKGNTCIARGTLDRPNELPEQIAAGRQGLQYYKGPAAPDIIASRYKTVKVPSIEELLDTLVAVGQATPTKDGRYVV